VNVTYLTVVALQALATASPATAPLQLTAADSQQLRAGAREAQARFEIRRVSMLPYFEVGSQPCEERIGRLCYSWGGRDSPEPPPEPPRIANERAELIDILHAASMRLPSDQWISGQLVRYLIEAGRPAEAESAAARACDRSEWWCAALAGYAAHEAGHFAGAESWFAHALDAMPPEQRCRWQDLSPILEHPLGNRLRRMSCDERRAESERVAWLARPLYTRPGNDLLTEHYSRLTLELVLRNARTPFGLNWGSDLAEMLVRYGWANAWTRRMPRGSFSTRPEVTGRERGLPMNFLPSTQAIRNPRTLADSSWEPESPRARSRYAPKWTTRLERVPGQFARFRRGDTVVFVAGWDVSTDTMFRVSTIAGLALAPASPGELTVVSQAGSTRGVLSARAHADSIQLYSLELVDSASRTAARARAALEPPGSARDISDILLTAGASDVGDLSSAIESALTSAELQQHADVGAYWEIYSLAPADSVIDVTLVMTPAGAGGLRRLAEIVRLAQRRLPVTMSWKDRVPRGSAMFPRAVKIDLRGVPEGDYLLEVEVRARGRTMRASRAVRVNGPA
jgi:hypothetical protein